MVARKILPEPEAADGVEDIPVVQHAAADPRNLVGHPPLSRLHVEPAEVCGIRRVVKGPAVPARGVRLDALRYRPPRPTLERGQLVRTVVIDVRQPLYRGPDHAAPQGDDRLVQPRDGAGLQP